MKRMRIGFLILSLVFSSAPGLAAADDSIYSLRGQGVLFYYQGGRAMGMGGATIALISPEHLNWLNPAALAGINRVKLSAHFLYQNLNIQDENTKFTTNYTNFNGMMGAFSVASGVGLGFGLRPVSKVNFSFESNESIGGQPYTRFLTNTGGLNRFFFSFGFHLKSKFYFGGDFGYIFGKEDEDWRVVYVDPRFSQSFDQLRSRYTGFNTRIGTVIQPVQSISIGGIYQTKTTLTQKLRELHVPAAAEVTSEFEWEMPALYGVGLAITPQRRFLVAIDYVSQDWSDFGLANSGGVQEFTQRKRLSLGVEYTPSDQRFANFWRRNRYRLGLGWEQPHFLDYSGNELSTLLVSSGLGIPFANGNGSIDIALEYGLRGSLPDNTFKESIVRLGIYITGSELWFQR